jgi:hypothetical protein
MRTPGQLTEMIMCWYLKDDKSHLVDFMSKMAKDPSLQSQYRSNPQQVLQNEGLSQEDQDLMLTQDREQIMNSILSRH